VQKRNCSKTDNTEINVYPHMNRAEFLITRAAKFTRLVKCNGKTLLVEFIFAMMTPVSYQRRKRFSALFDYGRMGMAGTLTEMEMDGGLISRTLFV